MDHDVGQWIKEMQNLHLNMFGGIWGALKTTNPAPVFG